MNNSSKFRGVGVALVTPFRSDGSLDESTLERLIDWEISEGVNFLVPCGTTGEIAALTHRHPPAPSRGRRRSTAVET